MATSRRIFPKLMLAIGLTGMGAAAQSVDAQSGWIETASGNKRIVTKGTTRLEIGPWVYLNGAATPDWLADQGKRLPAGVTLVSSKGVKKDSVPGSYSLVQEVRLNGSAGNYILYACPGVSGSARLMSMQVEQRYFADMFAGAMYAEKVCKLEPKGQPGATANANTSRKSIAKTPAPRSSQTAPPTNTVDLAALNAAIPAANRPRSAHVRLDQKVRGFPAQIVFESTVDLTFPNGYTTSCSNWDPLSLKPTPASVGRNVKGCDVSKAKSEGKRTRKFKPGETIDIKFGRITGAGTDGLNSSSGRLSGGDLLMTSDGRIALGKFSVGHIQSGGQGATATQRGGLRGQYYLNGHTITIKTDRGDVVHGFIAASSNSGSRTIDHIYINGEHYWDRD